MVNSRGQSGRVVGLIMYQRLRQSFRGRFWRSEELSEDQEVRREDVGIFTVDLERSDKIKVCKGPSTHAEEFVNEYSTKNFYI